MLNSGEGQGHPPQRQGFHLRTLFLGKYVYEVDRYPVAHEYAFRQDKVPLKEKLDQITAWIDLPIEERPQLIMGAPPSSSAIQSSHRGHTLQRMSLRSTKQGTSLAQPPSS